jgi:hypothetical protein
VDGQSGAVRQSKESIMTAVTDAPAAPAPAETESPAQEAAEQRAAQWANDYVSRLTERTQSRLAGQASSSNGAIKPDIGEPTVGPYVAFDVAATSPIQFTGMPPYQPSKIIADGEPAFLAALIFTNPLVDVLHGFAIPASVQLGGRTWRLTLDQFNLTTGTLLPKQVKVGVFGSPADMLTLEIFTLTTPNPGPDPWLIEANVTLDIVNPGQPYAAFATDFLDVDNDPGFPPLPFPPIVPPNAAGFRHELPNRYLIYSK